MSRQVSHASRGLGVTRELVLTAEAIAQTAIKTTLTLRLRCEVASFALSWDGSRIVSGSTKEVTIVSGVLVVAVFDR